MSEIYALGQGASCDAQVEARSATPIGTMSRKTLYRVEAFPPVDLPTLRTVLGDALYREWDEAIAEMLVPYQGEQRVPVGLLTERMGSALTDSHKAVLFSQPLWVEECPNLVVMAGLTDSLDKHLKGSGYTATWYVGLTSGTPTFAEGNTMASHSGWVEVIPYAGARPTLTLGTVVSGSVDNSASKAAYTINATMVVGGAFMVTLPTAGQTSGTLYGGAAFTGGNRSVASGDTLNVTITATATAA